MAELAVITPSYRNDWPLFLDLHESVLRYTPESVKHYVIVPEADAQLFSQVAGPRCAIMSEESLLPGRYKAVPVLNRVMKLLPGIPSSARIAAINFRRPIRPVRGWVMQQVLKMEVCRRIDADIVLLVDSDIAFVRPVTANTLRKDGRVRFYRQPKAVDTHLPDHVQWHMVSRELLGLPPVTLPAPDYVSSLNVWDPKILRALLARIEYVTHRHWMDAVTNQRTFSEWTLYGVFVDECIEDASMNVTESSLCHSYWDRAPLTASRAAEFVASIGCDDVAILIQSKSRTSLTIRRAALSSIVASITETDRVATAGPDLLADPRSGSGKLADNES